MKLKIVRGLPGSGKTSYVDSIMDALDFGSAFKTINLEADMFFMATHGEYKFRQDLLYDAHKWCYTMTVMALHTCCETVYVSNTFTTHKEMKPYLELVDKFPELEIEIHEIKTQYESIHDVSEETIQRMKNRWQEAPEGYKVITVGE